MLTATPADASLGARHTPTVPTESPLTRHAHRYWLAIVAVFVTAPAVALAQGELVGHVLEENTRTPVAGVTIAIPALGRNTQTDSIGRFRLTNLPEGDHVVQLRAFGFREQQIEVSIRANEVFGRDFVLERHAQPLPVEKVTAAQSHTGKLAGFWERRKFGIGHFLTRDELVKAEGGMRRTGDVLSLVPGVAVKRGSSRAWIASGRATNPHGGCAFCRGGKLGPAAKLPSNADVAAGAREACYMDVYLDGVLVFDSTLPENGLFDVNSLQPSQIEAIEVYTSAGQIPAQYNRTANGCGVLVLWTRL